MSDPPANRAEYGNWVSARLLYISGGISGILGGLSLVYPSLVVLALISFSFFVYFAYARYKFSPGGGNIQAGIQGLVLDALEWDGKGKTVDIGCGNGALTIRLAQKYPSAEVTGIDYWGGAWGYSKGVCERNAKIEAVAGRTVFQQASASTLPFEDETFDVAVSNLVFHEVRDVRDKKEVIKEALRVVKNGGRFVFQDLFLWKRIYGEVDDLLATIKDWGIERVEFVRTSDSAFIPKALRLPFMLGTIGILHGRK